MMYAFALGTTFSAMITFIGAAPAIVLGHWHLGETQFAYLFVPLIIGIMGGGFLSGKLAGRLTGTTADHHRVHARARGWRAFRACCTLLVDSPPIFPQQVLITVVAMGVQLMMPILRACACWTCFRTCAALPRRCSRA